MIEEIYLLWSPDGWGVYGKCQCPDPGAFPKYWYRKYEIPVEKSEVAFRKLLEIKIKLAMDGTIPTKDNYEKIFPDMSEI